MDGQTPRNAQGPRDSHSGGNKGRGKKSRGGRSRGAAHAVHDNNGINGVEQPAELGHIFVQYPYQQPLDPSAAGAKNAMGGQQPRQMMNHMMAGPHMQYQPQNPAEMMHMHRSMGMMHPATMPHPTQMPPGMMQMTGGWNMGPGVPAPMMMMALHQVMAQSPGPQHPGQQPPMQPTFQPPHPHPHSLAHTPPLPQGQQAGLHVASPQIHSHHAPQQGQQHHPIHHQHGGRYHQQGHHYGGGKGFGGHRKNQHSQAIRASLEMRNDDLMRASSPMLTRILVDMLREGEEGNARAWQFFERLCQLNKADVYQHSVMLNACSNSWAAETLMRRMEQANVKPSEVTYQKLYKIYLRDARVEEAEQVLEKMRAIMYADGASGLPDDYTNRVLTDMLLEMVKEGHQSEKRAWELFNRLRGTNKVNVIHYNVMLNTCKTTQQAVQLVQQARKAGIQPSERTCLKLAKMYIKEGNMPSHPGQLEAVMKGLKKTTLFAGIPMGQGQELDCTPLTPRDADRGAGEDGKEAGAAQGRVEQTEDEVVRLLQDLIINQQLEGGDDSETPPIPPVGCSPPDVPA